MRVHLWGSLISVLVLLLVMAFVATPSATAKSPAAGCATIQSGTITDSVGNPITVGFDQYGYNYQAHMFVGTYDSYDRVIGNQTGDYADDTLIMKWSDSWLSNKDCNHDGKLDRGIPGAYGTSRGWLTNHLNGDYDSNGDGVQDAHYTDFVKIVWVGPDGPLWGQYKVVLETLNDPAGGATGLLSKVGAPGFGLNDHWTSE